MKEVVDEHNGHQSTVTKLRDAHTLLYDLCYELNVAGFVVLLIKPVRVSCCVGNAVWVM